MLPKSGPRRVLALMPHPDDIEILCAGTLIRLRESGCEIHVATMTAGDKGSAEMGRTAIADIRLGEARRGAETICAASFTCLGFSDCEICFDNPSRHRIAGFMRQIDPWLVITTPPHDYMFDHIITSQLIRDACFNAPMPNYAAGTNRAIATVPYLYYTDAISGVDLLGNPTPVSCIVDIANQIETKSAALACHDSQRQWLSKHHGLDDYIDAMRRWSAKRGAEIGTSFAEAFLQHRGHPHPADDVLADILGAVRFSARICVHL